MNQNKSLPVIIGALVILVAIAVVFVQYSKKGNEKQLQEQQANTTSEKYKLEIVASHNTKESCWTTIDGVVYDVTKWIGQHPGGKEAIVSLCGKDGSTAFSGQHGGQPNPEKALAQFKIGELVK